MKPETGSEKRKGDVWRITFLILCFLFIFCHPPLASASSTSGAGNSMACVGGEPYYCAATDRAVRPLSLGYPTPAVNAPFITPEFGTRMVRATGPDTLAAFGDPNERFVGASSDYLTLWGLRDASLCGSAGGYRFIVVTGQNANVPFEFCPKTISVIQVVGTTPGGDLKVYGYVPISHSAFAHTDPGVVFGMSGNTVEAYCFPDANPSSPWCANGLDNVSTIFTFTNTVCPGMPANTFPAASGNDTMDVYTDLTDRYFEVGKALSQNQFGTVLIYDRQTGNCTWMDPTTFQYGGSSYGTAQKMNGGPLGDPTSPGGIIPAPSFSVGTTSGSIPAGTYYAVVTESSQEPDYNLNGESIASAVAGPITLGSNGSIAITPQPCTDSTWCSVSSLQPNFHVYLGTSATGPFWLQDYLVLGVGTGSQTAFGPATIPVYSQIAMGANILAAQEHGRPLPTIKEGRFIFITLARQDLRQSEPLMEVAWSNSITQPHLHLQTEFPSMRLGSWAVSTFRVDAAVIRIRTLFTRIKQIRCNLLQLIAAVLAFTMPLCRLEPRIFKYGLGARAQLLAPTHSGGR